MADVPRTRRHLTKLAEEHVPEVAQQVEHVAAELLANAMAHVGPPVFVRAHVSPSRFVLEVADRSALAPRPRVAEPDDEHGRGLPDRVRALAGLGVTHHPQRQGDLGRAAHEPADPAVTVSREPHPWGGRPRTYSA